MVLLHPDDSGEYSHQQRLEVIGGPALWWVWGAKGKSVMEVRAVTLALHSLPPCGGGVFMTIQTQGGGKWYRLLHLICCAQSLAYKKP